MKKRSRIRQRGRKKSFAKNPFLKSKPGRSRHKWSAKRRALTGSMDIREGV